MARKAAADAVAHVALLRGVNVGGKNLLPMKELAALFGKLGCGAVKTYIQSGNVAFLAPAEDVESLGKEASRRIRKQFGFEVPVLVRNQPQLEAVVANNPFLA